MRSESQRSVLQAYVDFGLVSSAVYVWLDYGFEVLISVVSSRHTVQGAFQIMARQCRHDIIIVTS